MEYGGGFQKLLQKFKATILASKTIQRQTSANNKPWLAFLAHRSQYLHDNIIPEEVNQIASQGPSSTTRSSVPLKKCVMNAFLAKRGCSATVIREACLSSRSGRVGTVLGAN